jgi:RimJ/RimL family protein N-acetyltransferase
MSGLPNSATKLDIALGTEKYLVRTLTPGDASESWESWFADPQVPYMLNAPETRWDRDTVIKYINQFDQRTDVLLGILVREPETLIGIVTLKINYRTRQTLINVLIGDAEYRNKGVLADIHFPLYDYLFDKLRMKMLLASALARNNNVIDWMLKRGWKHDATLPRQVKSNLDDTMLDLCLFSLTREPYRAWKKASRARAD